MSKIPMFGLFLFAASAVYADIDQVTQSGQWGTVCPPIVCSQPGDSWSYSFLTDSKIPFPSLSAPISDFTFLLNGVPVFPVPLGTYNNALWFVAANDGGFSIPGAIEFGMWTQLFTTPVPLSPSATLDPGVYPILPSPSFEDLFGADNLIHPNEITFGPVVITDTPEPSSVILLLTILLRAAFVVRKRVATRVTNSLVA